MTEAFQTDNMTLQTLEDQDHVPKREREWERNCSIYAEYNCFTFFLQFWIFQIVNLILYNVILSVCMIHDVSAGNARDISAVGHNEVEGDRVVIICRWM